ncbi:carbon-nitrogen hydrolase family protein [Roseovarius sp. D22-M7]|uniref:carbon-nitrogen hydrolase family protein n=1 Tax=Roseovarius sp. D22-M7 TaxID=3127116 RepID=UPI00300FFBFF
MRIATAAYPLDVLANWGEYESKIDDWIGAAAGQGADLAVFPEYGAMELATLDGPEVAGDLERSVQAITRRIAEVDDLHSRLAAQYRVHVLAASAPVFDADLGPRPVNRARLFTPAGGVGVQDKQIMTRYERDPWGIVPGGPLRLFDTAIGKIGVLICYDGEFPLLARALRAAELILVPSCTEAHAGYTRVRIAAMARALETQCVTVMASTVGAAAWSPAVDENTGTGGIFAPPDTGFPPTGVIAEGTLDQPGWTVADVDLDQVARVRADGGVLNRLHWGEQAGRDAEVTSLRLD